MTSCCTPWTNQYFPSGPALVHSLRCLAVDERGMRLAGQKVRPGGGVTSLSAAPRAHRHYPEWEQDRHTEDAGGKRLWPSQYCSACDQLPAGLCDQCAEDGRRLYDEALDREWLLF